MTTRNGRRWFGGTRSRRVEINPVEPDRPPCYLCGEPASYDVDGVDLCAGCLPPRED